VGITLFLALPAFASDWVIVLRDGATVTCRGPYFMVNGRYDCLERNGTTRKILAAEVDAAKTAAANVKGSGAATGSSELASPNSAKVPPAQARTLFGAFKGSVPPAPSRSRHIDYLLQPSREAYFVRLPGSYTGNKPYGLIVFIHSGDEVRSVPPGWAEVLDDNNLLFVAAQNSGNQHPIGRRLGLAVLGALEMKSSYKVDGMRIYTAGFSGGARMSNELAFYQSDLFKGTIQNCGADFYTELPRKEATSTVDTLGQPYGLAIADATAGEIERAKRGVRFVLITGSQDFRRGNILDIYNYGYAAHGFQAKLMDLADMGHDVCDGKALARAIAFLEVH
jgi:dienelactone hydrolase